MQQLLVSVKYEGFRIQLILSLQVSMSQIVQAMKQNNFIQKDVPINQLRFKSNDKQLSLNDTLVNLVGDNQQNMQIQIEQIKNIENIQIQNKKQSSQPSSQIKTKKNKKKNKQQKNSNQNLDQSTISSKSFKEQAKSIAATQVSNNTNNNQMKPTRTVRVLKQIVRCLQNNQIQKLAQISRIGQMDHNLSQILLNIRKEFQKIKKISSFYSEFIQKSIKCLDGINSIKQSLKELNQNYQKENFKNQYLQAQKIAQFIDKSICDNKKLIQLNEQLQQKLKNDQEKYKKQITSLQKKIKSQEKKYEKTISEKKTLQSKLQKLQKQNKQKCDQIIIKNKNIDELTLKNQQLIAIKNKQIQTLITKNQELKMKNIQSINMLNEKNNQLEAKIQLLEKNKAENIMLALQQKQKIIRQKYKNSVKMRKNANKVDGLSSIITVKQIEEILLKTLKSQLNSKNIQFNLLLSFNPSANKSYFLQNSFHHYMSNKKSILFIAISQNDKIFGGFTTEPITLSPEQYSQSSSNNISFLFSQINKNDLQIFKLTKDQPSIQYDSNKFILGNMDLVVNFKKLICQSKNIKDNKNKDLNITPVHLSSSYVLKNSNTQFQYFLKDKNDNKNQNYGITKIYQYQIFEVLFSE